MRCEQETEKGFSSAGISAVVIIIPPTMLIGMWLFQRLKLYIYPTITIGQTHVITVIFSTMLATAAAYFIVRKREILIRQLTGEIASRKRAETVLQQQSEQLRSLTARLAEVEDSERKRLAAELHDLAGQNLTALSINLNVMRGMIPEDLFQPLHARLHDSTALVKDTMANIRNVITDLRPTPLDDFGLTAAVRWYGELFEGRTGIKITMDMVESSSRLPARIENSLFRIFQEALVNVQKHAEATEVVVCLDENDSCVRLSIDDNGLGFAISVVEKKPAEKGSGWGLVMMRERAMAAGGHFAIRSRPGKGTQIIVEVKR